MCVYSTVFDSCGCVLLSRMTGVGGRPEVIIEGTDGNPEGDAWKVNAMHVVST